MEIRPKPGHGSRAIAIGILLALVAAAFLTPTSAAPAAASTGEHNVLEDGFEVANPAALWTITDANASAGDDHWAASTYRFSDGAQSMWAAGYGSHDDYVTVLSEGFEEGALPDGWSTWDDDPSYGEDYWGPSTARAAGGSYSLWCAQVGDNEASQDGKGDAAALDLPTNAQLGLYDNYMSSTVEAPVDLAGFTSATFTFSYWLDSESGYDYFYPMYFAYSSWFVLETFDGYGGGWLQASYDIPVYATAVGFLFEADEYVNAVGAFVDDIVVTGKLVTNNTAARMYDNGMDTTMWRSVSLTGYESAHVTASLWLETGGYGDFLELRYRQGSTWQTAQTFSGDTNGWQLMNIEIPVNSNAIAFRFVSDEAGRLEGAYVDDVAVTGFVSPLDCQATVSALAGTESTTVFAYQVDVTGGLRPLRWTWTFGDGSTSSLMAPTKLFTQAATVPASVVVFDSLGQSCSVNAPSVTVSHDMSLLSIEPASATVSEGEAVSFAAFDARGHSMDWEWSVEPSGCGQLSLDGTQAVFQAGEDAGGLTCAVAARLGTHVVSAPVTIEHDVSAPYIVPAQVDVAEGSTVQFALRDTYGQPLGGEWAASCGRLVAAPDGVTAMYTATSTGGNACSVTATVQGHDVQAVAHVVHDVSTLDVAPATRRAVEGGAVEYTVKDAMGHGVVAAWSVSPEACGGFSIGEASRTTFTVSPNAGGMLCTLTARVGERAMGAQLAVDHDVATGKILPGGAELAIGQSLVFAATDARGHPMSVGWSVTPSSCGALDTSTGTQSKLEVSLDAKGLLCTVTASTDAFALRAQVQVVEGPPAAITVAVPRLTAGGSVLARSTVTDQAGNVLDGRDVSWETTCAQVSPATGQEATVAAAPTAGGTTCAVTARLGSLTRTVQVPVGYAGPFSVTVTAERTALSPGDQTTLTARVVDANGNLVPADTVSWSAPCGSIQGTGETVTYTATAAADGLSCAVEATALVGDASTTGAATIEVATAGDMGLYAVVGAVAAAAAVGLAALALYARRRRGPRVGAP